MAPAWLCGYRDSLPLRASPAGMMRTSNQTGAPMDTKDNFMRIAVIASVILVGALAIAVKLHS